MDKWNELKKYIEEKYNEAEQGRRDAIKIELLQYYNGRHFMCGDILDTMEKLETEKLTINNINKKEKGEIRK